MWPESPNLTGCEEEVAAETKAPTKTDAPQELSAFPVFELDTRARREPKTSNGGAESQGGGTSKSPLGSD